MADVRGYAVHGAGAVLRSASGYTARWAARASLTRAGLARVGVVLAALAAVWFTEGGLRGALVGSLLLGTVLFVDCVGADLQDGERGDALGTWLTLLLARLREYLVYAGVAAGGALTGVPGAWAWASAALVALALYESVATARLTRDPAGAGDSAARPRPESPLAVMDPSRPVGGRAPSDPTLTAELLGDVPQRPDGGVPEDEPIRIRTVPSSAVDVAKWEEGRRRALRGMGITESGRRTGGAYPATRRRRLRLGIPRRRVRIPRPRVPERFPRARLRLPARFPQAARFVVIALTITIWDARVTFVALIVGFVIAVVGEIGGPPARHTAR